MPSQKNGFGNTHDVDKVAAWSVDRLGRSLQRLILFLSDLQAKGRISVLRRQDHCTSTPSGRAMFQMPGVFAEFEAAMIRERPRRCCPCEAQRNQERTRNRQTWGQSMMLALLSPTVATSIAISTPRYAATL
jgi:hypothetical protein